ncbi:pathogenicity island protein [Staphylococcus pseudintermedius]|uniref:TscA family type II toxin-antitoxin system antitoxin n=1 Tax=Staphylococcus TaxID=1279 RepID=UPI000D99B18D|nr:MULTISPECIES: pathogenicity island protein [Staphylococcus]EGQ1732021.1 pathogenicity island protein [Staphylococcus pseudintermedius]EGQ2764883.1 pathogenicity island protein [Staphylococcus pseudintermedius]EGQ4405284.1 pathogenicity island protein [Staphylococcus pseudintermedius]EHC9952450.1 pathogenicity island protein [Staphylococcus pseudintermedius]EHD0822987.1 pathogenicity island protein [Staphylococcus pseudintermedius]
MKIKQRYYLSKVVKVIEKVLDEKDKEVFLSAKDRFHSITDYKYNDTEFYEHILKLVHKELFNILAELDFDDEAFSILDEVTMTLSDVIEEDDEIYYYTVTDSSGEHKHTTDREGHVIGILEWALDYIAGNIEVEDNA